MKHGKEGWQVTGIGHDENIFKDYSFLKPTFLHFSWSRNLTFLRFSSSIREKILSSSSNFNRESGRN